MTRKSILTKFSAALVLSTFMLGCSLVDLNEPGPTEAVDPPIGLPSTTEDFTMALTGGESGRLWSALTFELEGHEGFQLCRLDDTFMFFSNGTYRYDGGDVLCGGEDDTRVKTGTWEINLENNLIVFDRSTSLEYQATLGGLQNGRLLLTGQVEIFGQSFDIQGIYETTL